MIGKSAALLLTCVIGFSGVIPAVAGESRLPDPGKAAVSPGPAAASSAQPGAPAKPAASVQPRKHGGLIANTAGAIAEAPGAICRQSAREFKAGVKDFTNNSSNPIVVIPAAIVSLPFGIAAGCVEGTIYAVRYRTTDNAPENMKKSAQGKTE